MKRAGLAALSLPLIIGVTTVAGISPAMAAEAPIGLGTATSYSVLGGQTVTNLGPSVLGQNLGLSPGSAVTGFPPGQVLGTMHVADAVALQAQSDLTIAYNDAASRATTQSVSGDLVGQTLVGGVYTSAGPLAVSGTLTLDGQNDPNSVFVFQAASTLTTGSASKINLINGASACNVYWQVGSSATLGTASDFKGTIMALTSISVTTSATVEGRALARNGSVTLDSNVFNAPVCPAVVPPIVATPPPVVATPSPTTSASTPPSAIAVLPPASKTATSAPAAGTTGTVYTNCSEAFAAGVSNIPSTDAAYSARLDRNKDGIACNKNGSDTAVLINGGFAQPVASEAATNQSPLLIFAGVGMLVLAGLTLLILPRVASSRKY